MAVRMFPEDKIVLADVVATAWQGLHDSMPLCTCLGRSVLGRLPTCVCDGKRVLEDALEARGYHGRLLFEAGVAHAGKAAAREAEEKRFKLSGNGDDGALPVVTHEPETKEAHELFNTLLPRMEVALGADHRKTLVARQHYADVLHEMGDNKGARYQLELLQEEHARSFGPVHPQTLACRANLAHALRMDGEIDLARAAFQAVVAGRTLQLGADAKDTVHSKADLAMLLRQDIDGLNHAVGLMHEVVESCARNPELGQDYVQPGRSQSFAMQLHQWQGEVEKHVAKRKAEAAIFNMATASGRNILRSNSIEGDSATSATSAISCI